MPRRRRRSRCVCTLLRTARARPGLRLRRGTTETAFALQRRRRRRGRAEAARRDARLVSSRPRARVRPTIRSACSASGAGCIRMPNSWSIRRPNRRRRHCLPAAAATASRRLPRRRRGTRGPARLPRHRSAAADRMEGIGAPRHAARARSRARRGASAVLDYAALAGLDTEARIRRLTAWVVAAEAARAQLRAAPARRRDRPRPRRRAAPRLPARAGPAAARTAHERASRFAPVRAARRHGCGDAGHAPAAICRRGWRCRVGDRARRARCGRRRRWRGAVSALDPSAADCLAGGRGRAPFGNLFGREPGSVLACGLLALKLLETERVRDARVALGFCAFVLMSALLFTQTLLFTLLICAVLVVLLAALAALQPAPRGRTPPLRGELRLAASCSARSAAGRRRLRAGAAARLAAVGRARRRHERAHRAWPIRMAARRDDRTADRRLAGLSRRLRRARRRRRSCAISARSCCGISMARPGRADARANTCAARDGAARRRAARLHDHAGADRPALAAGARSAAGRAAARALRRRPRADRRRRR